MSTDDRALVAALEAAGHQDVAKAMRTKTLAEELRALGRDDVAEQLTATSEVAPPPPSPAVDEGEQAQVDPVVAALDRDVPNWGR